MTILAVISMVVFTLACLGAAAMSGIAVYRMGQAPMRLRKDLEQAKSRLDASLKASLEHLQKGRK